MIKARYIGVDNELLQSGKVYKIKTISVMWNGKPRLRVQDPLEVLRTMRSGERQRLKSRRR